MHLVPCLFIFYTFSACLLHTNTARSGQHMVAHSNNVIPQTPADCAGRDLSASGELLELEALSRPTAAKTNDGKRLSHGDELREPDWIRLQLRCEALLAQTTDLRVLSFHTAALVRTEGFAGLARGLGSISSALRLPPADVHPRIDPTDDNTALERWFSVTALGAPVHRDGDVLRLVEGVRRIPFARTHNAIHHHAEVLAARGPDGAVDPTQLGPIRTAWLSVPADQRRTLVEHIGTARQHVASIEALLVEQVPDHLRPGHGLSPLNALRTELDGLANFLSPESPAVSHDDPARSSSPSNPLVFAGGSGAISSRAEAIRALQLARDYFLRTEPASPVPFFIDRTVRLVDKNFVDLLVELLPDAVSRFESLAGLDASVRNSC